MDILCDSVTIPISVERKKKNEKKHYRTSALSHRYSIQNSSVRPVIYQLAIRCNNYYDGRGLASIRRGERPSRFNGPESIRFSVVDVFRTL